MIKVLHFKEHLCKHRVRSRTLRPLSLAIITLNEEANLERCIRSVPFARDIVVLDSGSTDGTERVARGLNARFFKEDWRGYTAQKARAAELTEHDWVLSLDADEALSAPLAAEIQAFLEGDLPEEVDGCQMPRKSHHLGRWIGHGGWYPDRQLRLFHKGRAKWVGGQVHERVQATRVHRLTQDLHHFPFRDIAHQVDTNNKYSGLGAVDLQEKGVRFSLLKLITKPLTKFVELYVFKRGFLDGLPGFVIAAGGAYSVFLKWAKLWELQKKYK